MKIILALICGATAQKDIFTEKIVDLFPLEMQSMDQVFQISPIVLHELYKYFTFEMDEE